MEPRKVLTSFITREAFDKALEKIQSDPEFAVEGCHYEIAREERHQQVVNFIREQFVPDEPLSKSIAHLLTWTEEVEAVWMYLMKDNVSLILVSNSTGEIIAARSSMIGRKDEKFDISELNLEGYRKLLDLNDSLAKLCNVYDHYNVDEVMQFLALGVHRDYRRRGIGLKIMKAAVELVKGLGLNRVIIKGEGSSNYSKKIYEKLGFDILAEIVYDEYKEHGEVIFKNMEEHKSVKQYAKCVC